MERLTDKNWRNLDPWECCGQDKHCKRGCHEQGGCTNGCIVPKIYRRLAEYEDKIGTRFPTVVVVRCRDCKHFMTDALGQQVCNRTFMMIHMEFNDFCSYGEKREVE